MTAERALAELNGFIETYKTLTEKEKFGLARVFQEATGGKLSPFNSPSPVCVGVIPVNGPEGEVGFLGVRRAIAPCIGEVALAGGFLGTNEDPIAGVVREVLEETGIAIAPESFVPSNVARMGHNNNLLMFFISDEVLSFEALQEASRNLHKTDGEASELVFITPDTALCFPLHQEAVNMAFEEYGFTPKIQPAKSFKP
jgi:ADP-ribose pyrophosphatase YjhB (NUDIX family)